MEIRRGVLNRVKLSMVCNASATNFRVPPDFPGTFGYANVNHTSQDNSIRFTVSQDICSGRFFHAFLLENRGRIVGGNV